MAITVVDTFTGSGDPGDSLTFTPSSPLQAGDIYLAAWAITDEDGANNLVGNLTITPSVGVSAMHDISYYGIHIHLRAYNVSVYYAGATSVTVTINGRPGLFYIWLLRGGVMATIEGATADAGYTQSPWPYPFCDGRATLVPFGNNPFPLEMTAAEAGAFGVYIAGNHLGLCGGSIGGAPLTVTGGTPEIQSIVTGESRMELGLLGADGFVSDVALSASGAALAYGAYTFAVAMLVYPGTPPAEDVPPATRPDLVVHRNIFAGSTSAAVDLTGAINAIIENNSMQDCGAALVGEGCDFLAVSDNTIIGCSESALQLDTCTYSHITTNTIRDPGAATTAAIALVAVSSSNIAENRISTAGGAIPPDYAVVVDVGCTDIAIVQNDFRDGYSIAKIDDNGTATTARRNLPEEASDDAGPHLHTLAALTDVDTSGVQDGWVLTFDVASAMWVARPPSVLAVGELLVDSDGEFLLDDDGELLYEG